MDKKIIGILICMIFLFSTLPVVSSANFDKNNEELLMKIDNTKSSIYGFFYIFYGRIVFNGEEYLDDYFGWNYNVTPINLKLLGFMLDPVYGFCPAYGNVIDNPCYIPKSVFHGFVGKNYIFLLGYFIDWS